MIRKKFLLLSALLLSLCSFSAMAQDRIYLMDGSTVEAKVKEVGPKEILYVRWDNKEGAEYVVLRRDVERIEFENGTEEVFNNGRVRGRREVADRRREPRAERNRTPEPGYGSNIIAFAPLQMTNESAAGVGIHYERMLDKNGIFSLYVPVAFSFFEDDAFFNGMNQTKDRVFTYVYPGIKIYPAGSAHRVSYSVGPSLGLGFGDKWQRTQTQDPNNPGSIIVRYTDESVFKAGFLINNGLNIQPTKKLYVGLEFGIGILYSNNESEYYSAGEEPLVQFNFKMGYRF